MGAPQTVITVLALLLGMLRPASSFCALGSFNKQGLQPQRFQDSLASLPRCVVVGFMLVPS
jgi:hypothetical protein